MTPHSSQFSQVFLEKPRVIATLWFQVCVVVTLVKFGVNWWLVVKLRGIVSVFDNIFWIFEHFVTSKVHVLDTVKRNFEDMLNYKVVAFIGWKQNEDCILHAKVRTIL